MPPTLVTLGCTISTAPAWKAWANWNEVVQFSPAAIGSEPRRLDSAAKSSGGYTGSSTQVRLRASRRSRLRSTNSTDQAQFTSTQIFLSGPATRRQASMMSRSISCSLILLNPAAITSRQVMVASSSVP
ncbi:hypothetical protein D3C76_1256670 [compost metagenome]